MDRDVIGELKKWRDSKDRQPLILQGPRQVGKTYILEEFGKKCFKGYHYFNFEKNKDLHSVFEENLDVKRIIKELSFASSRDINADDLVIFDEIQSCPKA